MGKTVSNSGATAYDKGDVQNELFTIECKTATELKKSMSIKHEWLIKIKQEAFAMRRRYSALAFNFGGLGNKENYYIIDEALFRKLNELLLAEDQMEEG